MIREVCCAAIYATGVPVHRALHFFNLFGVQPL